MSGCSGRNMGFDFGTDIADVCFKRKHRWLFRIENISGGGDDGVNALPPSRSARPNVSFKEMEAQHLTETIYYPAKPEWKPITLVLYDIKKKTIHPIFEWVKKIYEPQKETDNWRPSCIVSPIEDAKFKKRASLELYDGCGNIIEKWVFENIWPQQVEFGDLDMSSSDIVTLEMTMRYDRAYIES